MQPRIFSICLFFILVFTLTSAYGQQIYLTDSSSLFPLHALSLTANNVERIIRKLDHMNAQYINSLVNYERKIKESLWNKDSLLAKRLFSENENPDSKINEYRHDPVQDVYNGRLDSIKTALHFLKTKKPDKKAAAQLDNTLIKLQRLEETNQLVSKGASYWRKRNAFLKQELQKAGLVKELKTLNRQVYYYNAHMSEWMQDLKDNASDESKWLDLVKSDPEFKTFFENHSGFASLFGSTRLLSGSNIDGLQTRAALQQSLKSLPVGNENSFLKTQLTTASQVPAKDQNSIEERTDSFRMLHFKPNSQKTKSISRRLMLDNNIQFGNTNNRLPTTADIGLKVGYNLNDDGVAGVGASCKLGLGKEFNHIKLTNEGYSLRSFIHWKIKAGLYLSGGYEKLFLPSFYHSSQVDSEQNSALIGLLKKYKISKKRLGSAELLFDFLADRYIPKRQPVVFRIGWEY